MSLERTKPMCDRKLGKGGRSWIVREPKPFVMPRGFNSLAVRTHHPPQASLAWSGSNVAAKRRQRVLTPCDRAPKLLTRRSPRRIGCGGNTEAPRLVGCQGTAGVEEQGIGTGWASQEPVRSPYSQSRTAVPGRRTGNIGTRRQEASSYLTERRRGLGLEPSGESISRWVWVRGCRSVL
jgi:hypothetical protein